MSLDQISGRIYGECSIRSCDVSLQISLYKEKIDPNLRKFVAYLGAKKVGSLTFEKRENQLLVRERMDGAWHSPVIAQLMDRIFCECLLRKSSDDKVLFAEVKLSNNLMRLYKMGFIPQNDELKKHLALCWRFRLSPHDIPLGERIQMIYSLDEDGRRYYDLIISRVPKPRNLKIE